MNILFINNLYGADSVGGAEQVVRVRAERFAHEGHRVFVLSSQRNKGTKEQSNKQGAVRHFCIGTRNVCWYKELSKHSFVYRIVWHVLNMIDIWTAREIVRFCREQGIDRVETHNLIGISLQVPRYLRTAGIDHHHYLHDVQLVEPSGILPADHMQDTLLQRLYTFFVQRLFSSPAVVYSPTRFLREFYASRGFFPASEWREAHIARHVPRTTGYAPRDSDKRRFLFVGSLVEHKGVRQLLAAWRPQAIAERYNLPSALRVSVSKGGCGRISNQYAPDAVTLTFVGDGALRPLVEEVVAKDPTIHYLGRVPHEELAAIYEQHDILVFPSQCIENRPNVIAEAMVHGLEIIAVGTGGVPEMVEGYERVRLVEVNDEFML